MKENNLFVFDTNIIISGFLFPDRIPGRALLKGFEEGIILVSNQTILELKDVLFRKKFDKYLSIERRNKLLSDFLISSKIVHIFSKINICRDKKDNHYLELAVNGNSYTIITGDEDLLVLHPFQNINIITPAKFLKRFPAS